MPKVEKPPSLFVDKKPAVKVQNEEKIDENKKSSDMVES